MEVLDCVDRIQRRIYSGDLLLLSRDRYDSSAFIPIKSPGLTKIANRSLEDIDAYYRSDPGLIVTKDPDATCVKRPMKYILHEQEEVNKNAQDGGITMEKGGAEHHE